tara:strand:+ start:33590 stop:34693 length:1104 start_codon:yes stop_codon:yes gene_type:complete
MSLRKVLDGQSFEGIFGFMFGTTSGLFFSFGLGVLISHIFGNIYNILIEFPSYINTLRRFVIVYYVISLFFVLELFLHYYSMKVDTGFTISVDPSDYQRPGLIIFLFNVQNALVYALTQSFGKNRRNYFFIFFYSIALITATLGQLIGSNFALISVLLLAITMLLYGRLLKIYRKSNLWRLISFRAIFAGWIGREILFVGVITLLISTFILYGLTQLSLIDLRDLRIFGDNWEINSLTERFRLFDTLFLKHFGYGPVFGNMVVHDIMETQYVHSLLSLLTHLGVTGAMLFSILVYFIYRDIEKLGKIQSGINFEYQLFRLLMITLIILFSIGMAFITWIPLWFTFGLFSISFISTYSSDQSLKDDLE